MTVKPTECLHNIHYYACYAPPYALLSLLHWHQVNDYLAKYLLNNAIARRINAIMAAPPLLKAIAIANNTAATTIAPKTNHFRFVMKFPIYCMRVEMLVSLVAPDKNGAWPPSDSIP
jgi:hypothetical protein